MKTHSLFPLSHSHFLLSLLLHTVPLSHTHTHSLTQTHTPSLSHIHSLSTSLTHTHFFLTHTLPLSHTHTCARINKLSHRDYTGRPNNENQQWKPAIFSARYTQRMHRSRRPCPATDASSARGGEWEQPLKQEEGRREWGQINGTALYCMNGLIL